MRKRLFVSLLLLVVGLVGPVFAQVPVATHVQILKAEDSRTYDAKLEALLKSPNAAVRVRAALAAGRIGDAAAVPALVKLLNGDASEKVREMAAFALGEVESIDAADAIRIALGETAKAQMPGAEKANVRGRLVEAAGKIAAAHAQAEQSKGLKEAIIFSLERELQSKADPNKETILLGLTAALRARPENADVTVRKFLAYNDPDIVATALNTLARLRAKNANKDARDLLETHTHAIVRANAARVLGAAEDKEAVDLLIKAAVSDQDARVRVSAIRSLAALRDQKAADPLLARSEELFAAYAKVRTLKAYPAESSELNEIFTSLGRLLARTKSAGAIKLLSSYLKLDGTASEASLALARIDPDGYHFNRASARYGSTQLASWKTLAIDFQSMADLTEANATIKTVAIDTLRAYILNDIYVDGKPIVNFDVTMAIPDALRAYAAFKTDDLGEILRTALKNKDGFVRTTAAGILGDLPASKENVDALKSAFTKALVSDKKENDAQLAILNSLFKLDKKESLGSLNSALDAPDYLVRKKAFDLITFDLLKDASISTDVVPLRKKLIDAVAARKNHVLLYDPKAGTKLGQVLNTDVDYRRALSRKNGSISAVFTTQKGSFTIEFLPEDAPLTVDNFVKLARQGYFNGLEVHRVVPNFVMQDGDPRGDGNGGPGWSIRCEVNMVPYERGAVGMALSGKDTGGSQWFVTHSPQPHLDGGYTVFGRVNSRGMEVVDKIVRGDMIVSVRIVGR